MTGISAGQGLEVWDVIADQLGQVRSPAEALTFAARFATLAPSGHNTQPWAFEIDGNSVTLRADLRRRLPVVDPGDRELMISCGAAVYGLRLALEATGRAAQADILPEDPPGALARVRLLDGDGPARPASPDMALFHAAARRHSNRMPFSSQPVPPATISAMTEAAAAEGAPLLPVPTDVREAVASLIAEGDRRQFSDASFRRELTAWIRPNRSPATDGIRGYGFGWNAIVTRISRALARTFDFGKRQAAQDRQLALSSPLLAVIATTEDEPGAWLAAGQAAYHALLIAAADGACASFLNQPIEVTSLRGSLASALQTTLNPQLLLRFGFGPPVRPQPRRPLTDVLTSA